MTQSLITNSEMETIDAGEAFSKNISAGAVVALFGDLGTGKTRFIKGVCKGLGVREHVASPTFTIVNEYQGTEIKIFHFDFYRMKTSLELQEIGFDEYTYDDGVCLIEWADRVREFLPPRRFDVFMKLGASENIREIMIEETSA
ncbi:MAG: tRNA (adenosine(37)-N6)-threonylcarbamoyltransferase complex ATPase subunit type 1 TsaE [Ignavibacteriales bacterium]|nr:tRNA (adenosine(37)-N6)-threonylcarbamoyltransferase complex ATPase subunit type 1 TsaE [Ignavibacteriales bacterium]